MEVILGVALGAALSWAASVFGERRQAGHEHHRWLRERRFEAWSRCFTALSVIAVPSAHSVVTPDRREALLKLRDLIGQLGIVGPPEQARKARALAIAIAQRDADDGLAMDNEAVAMRAARPLAIQQLYDGLSADLEQLMQHHEASRRDWLSWRRGHAGAIDVPDGPVSAQG